MKLFTFLLLFFTISLYSKQPPVRYCETNSAPWGCDHELAYLKKKPLPPVQAPPKSRRAHSCVSMIRFFQNHISPIDGPRSSYYPTSSQYALEAIIKYGTLQGIALGCDRLMRENGEAWVYKTTTKYGPARKVDPVR